MDIFDIISSHSNIEDSENLCLVSQEIKDIISQDLSLKRETLSPYYQLITKLKDYFSYQNHDLIYSEGLKDTFKRLITKQHLSYKDIIIMQQITNTCSSKEINYIKNINLMDYINNQNKIINITVGSLLKEFENTAINIFFKGYTFKLKIYYQDSNTNKYLPNCIEGQFYSWGYADRIGDLGDIKNYPILDLQSKF